MSLQARCRREHISTAYVCFFVNVLILHHKCKEKIMNSLSFIDNYVTNDMALCVVALVPRLPSDWGVQAKRRKICFSLGAV